MPRQNLTKVGRPPGQADLLVCRVVRRRRLSPSFVRVTLGGQSLAGFVPLGADQWIRLFLPVDDGASLARVPGRLTPRSYLRYLTLARADRPVMRSYTVAEFRADGPDGPELDLDIVLHRGADGERGRAADWAASCSPGDPVGLIDGGLGFVLPQGSARVELVGDVTALPALAGILTALPTDVSGRATVQLRDDADRRELARPEGVEVVWVDDAIAAVRDRTLFPQGAFGWVAGEAGLVGAVRRHWLTCGLPKDRVAFCGYWRAAHDEAPRRAL